MSESLQTAALSTTTRETHLRVADVLLDVLESLRASCEVEAAALIQVHSHGAAMLQAAAIAPAFVTRYAEQFAAADGWIATMAGQLKPRVVVGEAELPGASDAFRSFVDGWLAPQGLAHVALALVNRDRDGALVLLLARSAAQGPFADDVLARIGAVLFPLSAACSLDRLASATAARLALAWTLLDQWSQGLIVIDGNGRVLSRNAVARSILDAKDGLAIRDGRLATVRSRDAAALRRAFDDLIGAGPVGEPSQTKAVAISRGGDKEPLHLILSRLPFNGADGTGPAFAIFLSECGGLDTPPQEWLRDLFGLSPVDAEITSLLCQGLTTDEIARRLRASPHTVRAHLKRIFVKMGVNRQTDVVRLVMGGIGPVKVGRGERPSLPDLA